MGSFWTISAALLVNKTVVFHVQGHRRGPRYGGTVPTHTSRVTLSAVCITSTSATDLNLCRYDQHQSCSVFSFSSRFGQLIKWLITLMINPAVFSVNTLLSPLWRCTVTWRQLVEAGPSSRGDLTAAWTSRGAGGNTKWSVCLFRAMNQKRLQSPQLELNLLSSCRASGTC